MVIPFPAMRLHLTPISAFGDAENGPRPCRICQRPYNEHSEEQMAACWAEMDKRDDANIELLNRIGPEDERP